ncbi:hypothetical protein EJB05_11825, partial [Eragrostis curvula]
MEFSINNLPDDDLIRDSSKARLVVGEDGTPLMLFLSDHNEDDSGDLLHISKPNDSGPSVQWQLENIIPLPRQHKYSTVGVAEGFLFLHGIPKEHHHSLHSLEECLFREYFSFDIKTFELKKVCGIKHYFPDVQPYFGFPLSLSKPSLGMSLAIPLRCITFNTVSAKQGMVFLKLGLRKAFVGLLCYMLVMMDAASHIIADMNKRSAMLSNGFDSSLLETAD